MKDSTTFKPGDLVRLMPDIYDANRHQWQLISISANTIGEVVRVEGKDVSVNFAGHLTLIGTADVFCV